MGDRRAPVKEEDYTLDALGNWSGYATKTNGSPDLDQDRTHNDVNEITDVTETTGPSWVTPAHDAAGNITTIPKPADLTAGYTSTYDAFNRLVKIEDGTNTVAEYEYDGLNRRIIKSVYDAGSLDHRQHFYMNEGWQAFEMRKEVGGTEDTDPLEQYVWHSYYINALLLRDYDENTDGTSVRHYYTDGANSNVTAVLDDTGTGLEPWPKLFQILRATRETELGEEYTIQTVTAWMGNTPTVALKHHVEVRESDFERTVSRPGGAQTTQNRSHHAGSLALTESRWAAAHKKSRRFYKPMRRDVTP